MDASHVFPLIFAMGGYSWPTGKLPGRLITPEEVEPGDLMVAWDGVEEQSYYAMYLGAEQVFWMDHRMQKTDLEDWEDFLMDSTPTEVEVKMYRLVN